MTQSSLTKIAQQEKTRREIMHRSDLIPPLPDLVVRLLGLLNQPQTEPEHLEQLLKNDQVLVAKMLAIVNSPFYGLNRTVRTIRDAVMVLGFRGVRSLVLATSTTKFLQRNYACYGHEAKGLWLHSVCAAAGSRFLARECRMSSDDCEQLFVAGLLHDIGKLILVPYLGDAAPQRDVGVLVHDVEREIVGLDHTEAGALVTAKWNLAQEVQDIIKGHHDPAVVGRSVAVVRLADAVAHQRGTGYLPGMSPAGVPEAMDIAALGLSAEQWSLAADAMARAMEEAVAGLGAISN
jgi:putative nucleotidyltransferase with HDIG domain